MESITPYLPKEGKFYPWAHARCIRRSSDDKRTVVTINTSAKDRHGTIIDPEGGDITAYRDNPVFLINHSHDMVAGNDANVRLQNGQWIAEVDDDKWDLDDPEIARWFNKVKKGYVRMASIGFMPNKIERVTEEDEDGNEERKIIIRQWEMLEWSFTPIGSNPEALVQQRAASLDRKADNERLAALEQEINAIKNGGIHLSDDQIDQIAQRILQSGTTSTPEGTDADDPEREPESASNVLEYVEPRKTVYSPDQAVDVLTEKYKRKTGKA